MGFCAGVRRESEKHYVETFLNDVGRHNFAWNIHPQTFLNNVGHRDFAWISTSKGKNNAWGKLYAE
jgi:hypothetical protein